MVLTGRAAALALLAAVAVAVLVGMGAPAGAAVLGVNILLGSLLAVDVLRAAPPGALALSRSGDRKVRLGQTAHVVLTVRNTGRRRWRGLLRDAWSPTAGARIGASEGSAPDSDRIALVVAPGEVVRIPVEIRPTRRGDRPTDRVTLRSLGPWGLAGRQRSTRVDWSV
jgi:uncharacterized protein (DUF58 family)